MRLLGLCVMALALGCAMQVFPESWPRMGNERASFVWDASWGALPEGESIGNTHGGMAVDRRGWIYASRDAAPAVLVFDSRGRVQDSWGDDLAGGLHGMCLVEEGGEEYLYLAHTGRHEILKTTLDGEVLWTLGVPPAPEIYENEGQYLPTGVAVAADGSLFVADGYGKGFVHRYNAEGEYLGSFGGPGKENGQFHTPHGVAIDARSLFPRVLVADRENGRVQAFDFDGNFLEVIATDLRRPCGVAVGADGRLAIPELAGRVTVFDEQNQVLAHLGDNPNQSHWANNGLSTKEWEQGVFISPHGAAFDHKGNLYVQDWLAAGRFTRLVRGH